MEKWVALYILVAGPVPSLLTVCQETRHEAKKHYSLVRSKLPYKSQNQEGERPAPGKIVRKPKWAEQKIWVNPMIDTLYLVNFPSMVDFLNWFRCLSSPKVGGLPLSRPIKNIAFNGTVVQRLRNTGRTNVFYHLCMKHPRLESITIVFDNSAFESGDKPHLYSFKLLPPMKEGDNRTGGTYGKKEIRKQIESIFQGFWVGKSNIKDCDQWQAWRKRNPGWKEPEVNMMKINKTGKSKNMR